MVSGFTTLAVLALVYGLAYALLAPHIDPITVVDNERILVITGYNFGAKVGDVTLTVSDPNCMAPAEVWTPTTLAFTLPDACAGGTIRAERNTFGFRWRSNTVPFVVQIAGLPSEPYGYTVPVLADSPWPTFRRDQRNTGGALFPANYAGDAPWAFQTGKGIFSTPIVDANGVVYVGSADHNFYAINSDGSEKWRFPTGEIIDSSGALLPGNVVIFPSGDGFLYVLRMLDGLELTRFDARVAPHTGYNNWWEGNIAVGYDGVLYAGNTNFNYYAINPDGKLRWTYATGANNWSQAGISGKGTLYWGSNDTFIRAVNALGKELWRKRTLGFIAASAAVGMDGTVYIGSFDSYFYALDGDTGKVKWRFKTNDHIYASAALAEDADGNTAAIYVGSADGNLYALDPAGALLWRYDVGDPIRSSPVVGRLPGATTAAVTDTVATDAGAAGADAASEDIVYFGAGNGKLYALNAADGSRRWSYNTTSSDSELRDRNDLNGSPALGVTGVYIGGEHGQVWYVPYDYCLHAPDSRCETDAKENLPDTAAGMFYVTPGGNTWLEGTPTVPVATLLTLRLLVRQDGETVDAALCNKLVGCPKDALSITATPDFPFAVQKSADGHYVHIIPEGFLETGTLYQLAIEGNYYTGGTAIGNLTLGGRKTGHFTQTLSFRTMNIVGSPAPTGEWTRFAVPVPAMLPSLNQIGFDYLDWMMGIAATGAEESGKGAKTVVWIIGAQRDETGALLPDPDSDFILPLSGSYKGGAFILASRALSMSITGIPIPFNRFELRGQYDDNGFFLPDATLYADADALKVPTFGPYLVAAGLANDVYKKLLVSGTYLGRSYNGPSSVPPAGVQVQNVTYTPPKGSRDGVVSVTLALEPGAVYPLAAHRPGILLLDAANTEAVSLDYRANLSAAADANGNLASITLTVPAGLELPEKLDMIVMLDVAPLHRQSLEN